MQTHGQEDLYIHVLQWRYEKYKDLQYQPFMEVELNGVPSHYIDRVTSGSVLRCAGPGCR
jgi:hypothetical protein